MNVTNGDGPALALSLVGITLLAFAAGNLYTGKTWCNYFCPVSFIEKLYTESHGLRETQNSQCTKCTACKNSCPDISQENGYWKEIRSEPKRIVYFAFPGLVFGFYFYYFLQAGTWSYYFGGSWTDQPQLWRTALLPGVDAVTAGFFFLPRTPRALASFLTLGSSAVLSFAIFFLLERTIGNWTRPQDPANQDMHGRHIAITVAAFAAFVTFYTFAGAPTLRKLPWGFPHLFLVVIVITATLFLVRRIQRSQTGFAEETLARNILKRWQWTDVAPPKDLREAFLIHQVRTQEKAKGAVQIVDIYREAVREAVADGFVTREEVQMLETLRNQLQLKEADHETVMLALAEEERAMLCDPLHHVTVEKRLQLETYARALSDYFERILSTESSPDESFIRQLSAEYRVTRDEHEAVLARLMGDWEGLAARLAAEVRNIESAAVAVQVLEQVASPAHGLLCELLRRSRARAIERLLRGLSYTNLDQEVSQRLGRSFASQDASLNVSALEELQAQVAPQIADRIIAAHNEQTLQTAVPTLMDLLHEQLGSIDPYVRAVVLYALFERGAAAAELLQPSCKDESQLVRETAEGLLAIVQPGSDSEASRPLLTIEKMIALRSAHVFKELSAESLAGLAHGSSGVTFPAGAALCNEGEEGNEVFILLEGDVKLFKHEGAQEKLIGSEHAGGLIGEMAVLDAAPRSASVIAGDKGVTVLRLDGIAFREALAQSPSLAVGVIRTLAHRLRHAQK